MTQEPIKVYELAKELGIDSISLVDRLKSMQIDVKNHMSDLTPEQVQSARAGLVKPAETKAKPKTPRATTKTAATKTAAAPTTAAKTAPAKTPAAKAPPRKKAAVEEAAPPVKTEAASTPATPALSAAPVIRRRVRSDEGGLETTETTTARGVPSPYESTPSTPQSGEETAYPHSARESGDESAESGSVTLASTPAPAARGPMLRTSSMAPVTRFEAPPATAAALSAEPPLPPGSTVNVQTSTTGIRTISLKRDSEASAAPRRNMLNVADKGTTPGARSTFRSQNDPSAVTSAKERLKGTETKDKDGFRIVKISKENLDKMSEEEATKRKGGVKAEIRPEDVHFADYRKKEMVFLPKKKKIPVGKHLNSTVITEMKAEKRVVEMQNTISVQDIANQMKVKAGQVITKLMGMGQMATINQALDFDTATLLATEFQYEVRNVAFSEVEIIAADSDTEEQLQPRPPVVTIMGHVDHGKTTLLDSIRSANVAGGEKGGITQHIGAYTIVKDGKMITFIDTPGHEAFTSMRARGANVTDIVVLVVSADDGVMPQTREAIAHAKSAGVPIIVAVNKIDKPGANPEKPKQALAELELLAEDWGGDTMFVPVSALKGTNIDKLLESILLVAEVQNFRANPQAPASGVVLESRLEKGKGPVATILLNRGTLHSGDIVVAGVQTGSVRAMIDHLGRQVKEITPGMAVEILGLSGVPSAGERFDAVETDQDAARIVDFRKDALQAQKAIRPEKMTLDALFAKIEAGETKELRVILKADVFGSVEAVKESLLKASTEKVKVNVIHSATGGITESDILLATASHAVVIGFNVRPETKARQVAESEHVEVKCYGIIYELIEDVKKAMAGLMDKKKVEKFLGRAEVRQTFTVPKVGMIAGTSVIDGKMLRGANVRLLRDSKIIYEGKMSSLRRFKDDAKEVAQGYECGIGLENYNDLKPGDIIEAYQIDLVTQELS